MLKKEILKEKFERVEKDLFSLEHTKDLASSPNKIIREFYSLLSSNEFISLMKKLSGENLTQKIDMQSHIFRQGDYLLFHDDELEGRGIAYIVYLSDFSEKDGGRLRLYDIKKPIKPVNQIMPRFNTFACFKVSKKSMHDVEEVLAGKQRMTVGGWFYAK